jgi:hypothetical protein
VPENEVIPYSFLLDTNLITLEDPTDEGWHGTRVMIDHLPMSPDGVADTFDVTLIGYGEPTLTSPSPVSETQTFTRGGPPMDFRVGGKAVMLRIEARDVKTVFHFGNMAVRITKDHPR